MRKNKPIDNETAAVTVGSDIPMIAVDINEIHVDEARNQRHFASTKEEIEKLANSIMTQGQLQPVLVRERTHTNGDGEEGKRYELFVGFQRVTAIQYAITELGADLPVLARVMNTNDESALMMNLDENLRRKELSVLDVAYLVKTMHDGGMQFKDIAARFNKTASWASQQYAFTGLRAPLQKMLHTGKLTPGFARELVGLEAEQQDELIARHESGELETVAQMNKVRQTKKKKSKRGRKISKVPTLSRVVTAFEELATPPAKDAKKETPKQAKRRKIAGAVRQFLLGELVASALGKAIEKLA